MRKAFNTQTKKACRKLTGTPQEKERWLFIPSIDDDFDVCFSYGKVLVLHFTTSIFNKKHFYSRCTMVDPVVKAMSRVSHGRATVYSRVSALASTLTTTQKYGLSHHE